MTFYRCFCLVGGDYSGNTLVALTTQRVSGLPLVKMKIVNALHFVVGTTAWSGRSLTLSFVLLDTGDSSESICLYASSTSASHVQRWWTESKSLSPVHSPALTSAPLLPFCSLFSLLVSFCQDSWVRRSWNLPWAMIERANQPEVQALFSKLPETLFFNVHR